MKHTTLFGALSRRFFASIAVVITFAQLGPAVSRAQETAAPTGGGAKSAAQSAEDVFLNMLESELSGAEYDQTVIGTNGKFRYGAEKEASSSLITRVMGPNKATFLAYVNKLEPANRVSFLRDFLGKWISGSYRARGVKGNDGQSKDFAFSQANLGKLDEAGLRTTFEGWLEKAGDRSFSFVSPQVRRKIFNGELPGQSGSPMGKIVDRQASTSYNGWLALYGDPEKYIQNAHNTSVGWEINFNPMPNYGEFTKMQNWFTGALKNAGEEFDSPGHQRLVFPQRNLDDPTALAKTESKLGEVYKILQAYILLRGQEGRAGMETANYKDVASDAVLRRPGNGGRYILRLEKDRFGKDTYAIEFRGGTKTDTTRQFTQTTLVARYAADDFAGIADSESWVLVKPGTTTVEDLMSRFEVPRKIAGDAIAHLTSPRRQVRGSARAIDFTKMTPFWGWENAPFLSAAKKASLRELTRVFIVSAAAWQNPTVEDVENALQTWASSSHLSSDLQHYVGPKSVAGQDLDTLLEYHPPIAPPLAEKVDVNQIDLGIEYTSSYPIKLKGDYVSDILKTQSAGWLRTEYDLSEDERKDVLKKVAENLAAELGIKKSTVYYSAEATHGNSLEMAYEFKDQQNRTVRVEWDGIGRSYDSEGDVIDGSPRGGHIEVVTPKFVPTGDFTSAVFRAYDNMNLIPQARSGGGHINIDLAPFEGKPEALARFITVFHRNRGVIALMFQHPGRLRSAEPLDVSPELAAKLANFSGTEAELKTLLYESRYFNTRLGRKTRYSQLDLSAYFQDVIPEQFIHEDFDIKNALWRKNFTVEPKVRKAEFRLFDAPKDEVEAALQIRLVRGMLSYALNGDGPAGDGVSAQAVDFAKYVREPRSAFADLQAMASELALDPSDYRRYVIDGLNTATAALESPNYQPLNVQLARNPKQEGWGDAVAPRDAAHAIGAEGRVLEEVLDPDPAAVKLLADRKDDNAKLDRLRADNAVRTGGSASTEPGQFLPRGDVDAYLDRIISLPNRADLPLDDALRVIYENLGGPKDKKASFALKKIMDDPKRVADAFVKGLDQSDPAFRKWIMDQLQPGRFFPTIEKRLIRDADPQARARGYELLRGAAEAQIAALIVELNPSAGVEKPGVVEDGVTQLKGLKIQNLPSKARPTLVYWLARLLDQSTAEVNFHTAVLEIGMRLPGDEFKSSIDRAFNRLGPTGNLSEEVSVSLARNYLNRDGVTTTSRIANAINSKYESVRRLAITASVRQLAPRLLSKKAEVRNKAYAELRAANGEGAIKIALATRADFSDSQAVVKDFVAFLEATGGSAPRSTATLMATLKAMVIDGEFQEIREAAVRAIGLSQTPESVAAVRELLQNANPRVRQEGSAALVRPSGNGPAELYEVAASVIGDSDAIVRENAGKAFTLTLSVPALGRLFDLARSDQATGEAARSILKSLMATPQLDLVLSGMLEAASPHKQDLLAILADPGFKGAQTFSNAVALSLPGESEYREAVFKRLRTMDDSAFIRATIGAFSYSRPPEVLRDVSAEVLRRNFSNPSRLSEYRASAEYLVRYGQANSRSYGASLINHMSPAEALQSVPTLLSDSDAEIRRIGAEILATHASDPAAFGIASGHASSEADPAVRRHLDAILQAAPGNVGESCAASFE